MTKILFSLIVSIAFVAGSATGVQAEFRSAFLAPLPVPDCSAFTIDNASSDSLGTVTVNGLGSSQDFNVDSTGYYEHDICFTAFSVTVNAVTVNYPNSDTVQLASGAWVRVAWQSSSLIEISNDEEVGSPAP
jgi:hypothetical protein